MCSKGAGKYLVQPSGLLKSGPYPGIPVRERRGRGREGERERERERGRFSNAENGRMETTVIKLLLSK
jgi:hypothetical protein